jgi:hypothetical protein
VLYARGHREPDLHTRIYVPIYTDPSVARAWLDFFIDGEQVKREGDTLHLDSGIRLKSEQLDKIMDCTAGELSTVDERRILRFKHGTWEERHEQPTINGATASKTKPEVVRERRPVRPDGYVTITELCTASGMLPMIARAALRASGRDKPDYGWAFDPKEVPAIKAICGMK